MSVTLLPPLTRSGPWQGPVRGEALTEGPGYARTRAMSRWHRVRSATRHSLDGEPLHTSFHVWCGQSVTSTRAVITDTPADGVPVCGTCEGRAEGYNPDRPDLLFTPEGLRIPAKCPNRVLHTAVNPSVGRCLACGELAPLRWWGWNATSPKLSPHAPLNLVPGCPFHAWRYLAEHEGTARCRCQIDAKAGESA